MPHILVVESNPRPLCDRLVRTTGSDFGPLYAAILTSLRGDVTTQIISPYEGEAGTDLSDFDGVAFTGSSVDWNTDDDRAAPLADVMRRAFAAGLPVIGSCNGMQLAASLLGGATGASPHGREDGLAREIRLTESGRNHPMMVGREVIYSAPCTHRDEVVRLPEGAVRLAGNAHSEVQAFVCEGDGMSFWGMQYHPEFEPAYLARYLKAVGKGAEADLAALAAPETPAAARMRTTELRNWLARF
jgi:GMP synthase (glutamine-hydrolysing)